MQINWPAPQDFGAAGDGVADDTAAFQSLIASLGSGGVIYLPGQYKVSATLDFSALSWLKILGDGFRAGDVKGSVISGTVDGPIIKYAGAGATFDISCLSVFNWHSNGKCIHATSIHSSKLEQVQVTGNIGLYFDENIFSLYMKSIKLTGNGPQFPNSIGLVVPGHSTIDGIDASGWCEAIRACGPTVNIRGGRFEVNKTALRLGINPNGTAGVLTRSAIEGNSFEANDCDIDIHSISHSTLSGMGTQGSVNAQSGQSKNGIIVRAAMHTTFNDLSFGGSYSGYPITICSGSTTGQVWNNVSANNALNANRLWDVRVGLQGLKFTGTTNYRPSGSGDATPVQQHSAIQSLSVVDYLRPMVIGKNLRGKAIPVAAGATSHTVQFTKQHSTGQAAINTIQGATGGTLQPGTYYYAAAAVTERGESGAMERSVVVSAPNNAVALSFYGMPADGFRRRIYRGTSPGIYDGYFDLPLNGNALFTDSGQVFSGFKSPSADDTTSMVEPDQNYAVFPSLNWDGGSWVTNKTTEQFTVNFAAAPPGATLDYFMVR